MTLDTAKEKVNQQLSTMEGELIGLMEGAINTPSPPGYEKEVCEYLAGWMNERDIDAHVQDIEPTRGNVVGRLSGTGGGKSVTFNAHMDTTFVGTEEDDLPIVGKVENVGRPQARLEDGLIYGLGAFNDKGPFVCACIAAHAIKKSGVTLQGDVLLAGVGGEIGRGQIGNLKGPGSRGKGIGSYYLLHFGEWTDYAIVCEGSNWSVSWALAGAAYFRITSRGEATYAPFNEHGAGPPSEDPNAIVKTAHLVLALEEWAKDYERRSEMDTPCGRMTPKVTIGAIDGGQPIKPNWRPALSNIYLDVRIPPNRTPLDVKREVEQAVRATGLSDEVEMFLARRGFIAEGVEPIAAAVSAAHTDVFGASPPPPHWNDLSQWNDLNIFAEHGIPVIKYGPDWPDGPFFPERMAVTDLLQAARVYANAALRLCGVNSS